MINKPDIVWTIVEKNKNILLCQRAYDDSLGGLWTLPGGSIESSDHNLCYAAQRELMEEAGISGYNLNILFETKIEKRDHHCFKCTSWSGNPYPCSNDIIGVGWFSLDQIYIMQNLITPYLLLALPFIGYMSVQDIPCLNRDAKNDK
jgi:ADP-ribose pyrophosphatase YjhB (NUDIX family)